MRERGYIDYIQHAVLVFWTGVTLCIERADCALSVRSCVTGPRAGLEKVSTIYCGMEEQQSNTIKVLHRPRP